MDALGADVVTFIRRDLAGVDRYGDDVRVDHETDVGGCSMQPMWGQETVGNLDQVIDRWRLFMPVLALIDQELDPEAVDRVRFRGLLYEINGKPQVWTDLSGNLDHLVLFCKRVEG